MTEDCVFCGIVDGSVEPSIAYEDEATLAFMDIRQFHEGHTLIVPKRHIKDIYALDDATGAALISAVARVARAVRDTFEPHGLNIWQSNGAPWQEVFHLHMHVLPRWQHDGILRFPPPRNPLPRAALDEQANRIRSTLAG